MYKLVKCSCGCEGFYAVRIGAEGPNSFTEEEAALIVRVLNVMHQGGAVVVLSPEDIVGDTVNDRPI